MKKIVSLLFAVCVLVPTFAQYANDFQTYDGEQKNEEKECTTDYSCWLPKAGDWNITVGMNPLGITMGGTWSNIGGFAFGYMVTDMIAVKASLGLDIEVWNNRGYARDDAAFFQNSLSTKKVKDTRKDTRTGGSASLGLDFHIGNQHKVQGVFGVGLMYGFRVEKRNYSYGNGITEFNQVPTITTALDRDGNAIIPAYTAPAGSDIANARVLSQYNTLANPLSMVGLYGSAGIEWFVTPKLALGLNASLNIMYQFMNAYTIKYEGWSSQRSEKVEWTDAERPKQDGFAMRTSDLIGLNIFMSVYL